MTLIKTKGVIPPRAVSQRQTKEKCILGQAWNDTHMIYVVMYI